MTKISVDSLPQAVIGAQVSISREELRQLRSEGRLNEEVDKRMSRYMAEGIMKKHKDDLVIVPIDAAFTSSGRAYQLEIVTFNKDQWVAHYNEWMALEAERDELKKKLAEVRYPSAEE